MYCQKCGLELQSNWNSCPQCGKSIIEVTIHEQQIINDEKLRIATRQKEKVKNNLGCIIFIAMIMLMVSFVILFFGNGPSFGGLMFVAVTIYVIYATIKSLAS